MNVPGTNLILIGLRGSGKSTLGRRVAQMLGRPFADLDDDTALLLGARTAGEAFKQHGEQAFRNTEAMQLPGLLSGTGVVHALGGGTPTAPGAERMLRLARDGGQAVIIYLRASPAILRARLAATDITTRPSLTDAGTLDEIEQIFHARDALYQRVATHVIEVGTRTADDLAGQIVELFTA